MGEFLKLLKHLAKFLIPPPGIAASEEEIMRNRWATSISILAIWLAVAALSGELLGYDVIVFPPVARASDVAAVAEKTASIDRTLNEILVYQVKQSIAQQTKSACLARRAKNQGDLDSANNQLANSLDRYRALAGADFHVQSCDTVLVDGS